MRDNLEGMLSTDMNIKRFVGESKCDYNQRLIYSAGASWIRELVFGHSYADDKSNNDYVNTDIMYLEFHLSKVMYAYLQCFEINTDWLKIDDKNDLDEKARALASEIIKEMIYTYSLVKLESRRIAILERKFIKIDNNKFLIRGENLFSNKTYSIGVAQWMVNEGLSDFITDKKIVDIKGMDYYLVMDTEFIWKSVNLQSEYLIFKVGSTGEYSKCWVPVNTTELPRGISIIRLANEYNGGYILVKKKVDKIVISELDPWYMEEREIYRILYALNYKNHTPAVFVAKKHEGYYILKYSSAIPCFEDRIINCCSWPYKTYDKKYIRIIPELVWDIVVRLIEDMGIIISYI